MYELLGLLDGSVLLCAMDKWRGVDAVALWVLRYGLLGCPVDRRR